MIIYQMKNVKFLFSSPQGQFNVMRTYIDEYGLKNGSCLEKKPF